MPWYVHPLRAAILLALFAQRSGAPVAVVCPDQDGDRVCDAVDRCQGDDALGDLDLDGQCGDLCFGDDAAGDADQDGLCDDRDRCRGDDRRGDSDADGVCDDLDRCPGPGVVADRDGDRRCEDQDLCFGEDTTGDEDGDRICTSIDVCFGGSQHDDDEDGLCVENDLCDGDNSTGDDDGDGLCGDVDLCLGANGYGDDDLDGVCWNLDPCVGDQATGDADADEICDDEDLCPGLAADPDGDNLCGAADRCLGRDQTGDRDGDQLCDDIDPCDDRRVAPGTPCVVPQPLPENRCAGTPIVVAGRHTGFVTCPDGAVDRLFATAGWLQPETETPVPGPTFYGTHACRSDADCTELPYGACTPIRDPYETTLHCRYGCDADADCGVNQICLPPGVGTLEDGTPRTWLAGSATRGRGLCTPATCAGSADCASGECGYSYNYGGCGYGEDALVCRDRAVDQCRTSWGCPSDPQGYRSRSCVAGETWECTFVGESCGRPLLGPDGLARLPATPATKGAAAAWTRVAAMEQASVASFARHALELLALGAPADLLAAVVAAQADERRHAALALDVVAHLGGERPTLGPLPLHDIQPRRDPEAIFDALVREGCLGETLAAAEAQLLADTTADPIVASALARIARDEARHAALAWRTVGWMAAGRPDRLARLRALAAGARPGPGEGDAAWGVIDDAGRARVFVDVMGSVVGPALEALAG
jgi:hypothetical protein